MSPEGEMPIEPACRHTAMECLVAVARHHGIDRSVPQLVHEQVLSAEPDAHQFVTIARAVGLTAKGVTVDWGRLVRMAPVCPLVARLRNGNYVLVVGFEAEDGAPLVRVFDPLEPPRPPDFAPLRLDRATFEASWAGEIVLLKRRRKVTDPDQPFGLRWFVPEILRQRDAVVDVAVAALVLHAIALGVPIFFQIIVDKVLVNETMSTLVVLAVGVTLAIVFEAVISYLRGALLLDATSRIDIRVATRSFSHLLSLPAFFFQENAAGVLARHMQQSSSIREFLTGRLLMTLLDASVLLVFVPVLAFYNGNLTLVVIGFSVATAGVIAALIGPYRRRLNALYEAEAERQSVLVETIHGMGTVKALALEPRQRHAWDDLSARSVGLHADVGRISVIARSISTLLEKLMTVAVVALGAMAVFDHQMTVGELVAFQMLTGRVSGPLVQLTGLIHQYQETALSVRMLGAIMNRKPEANLARGLAPRLTGRVELDRVSFTYPGTQAPALDDVSLVIPSGAFVGVVGASGSGKSTLARLIQGLHPVTDGLIRFDGYDLREMDLVHLRRNIGVVPQDAFLFRGTVRDNIGVTRPDATFEAIVEAARAAGADTFVQHLPQGYDTMLEEGAVNLSGGQRQRLSIARALLRDPPILILDEATSALDPDSEAVVVANLEKIARNRTTIVISHRLATIVRADLILVIDHGAIIDQGRHDELIERCSIYRTLWKQQTRGLA